jgi:hypothetical protein
MPKKFYKVVLQRRKKSLKTIKVKKKRDKGQASGQYYKTFNHNLRH